MKRYYGKNAISLWLIDSTSQRTYRSYTKRRRKLRTNPLPNTSSTKQRYDTHRMRAIEHIQDLPELPFPIRRLTPAGRMYEIAKDLAVGFIILDPLDIIDDD